MDNRSEVREFLITRRAKVTPADVGIPDVGQRRVPGLRRGEVAALAGVSIEYYSKLERGSLAGVSASVLDAIARALRLDDAERSHLFNLAQAADGTSQLLRPRRRGRKQWALRPSLNWVLDCITGGPAIVRNGRMDLLATNQLGRAMHASLYERSPGPVPNFARYTFLDEDSHHFYSDWDTAADTAVAILRTEAGRDPHDPLIHDLVGELATRSEEFRRRWANHDVRLHGAGTKSFHHNAVGDLELAYESVDLVSDPGLTLTIYAAEPASRSADALALLGSLTAPEVRQLHTLETPERQFAVPAPSTSRVDGELSEHACEIRPPTVGSPNRYRRSTSSRVFLSRCGEPMMAAFLHVSLQLVTSRITITTVFRSEPT